jgi:hypothetical protein
LGFLTDASVDALLDLFAGTGHGSAFPSSYDVALSKTQPNNNGTGVTEPSGAGYARVDIPAASWGAAATRQKTNSVAVTFAQPTGDWGVVGWFCLYDHGTSTFRAWGALSSQVNITAASDPPVFGVGALVINAPDN